MKYLVVGGAGYIGSHLVKRILDSGDEVVVFDNLSRGHRESVASNSRVTLIYIHELLRGRRESVESAAFVRGDVLNPGVLRAVLRKFKFDGVFHFAALAAVGESVANPADYYRNNVNGTVNLLDAMRERGVKKIIFSSSAAVYGSPARIPISETHPKNPINPYGRSKLACEWMLDDYSRAYGISYAALRYFNAAGAAMDGSIGEDHEPETHLVPAALKCALNRKSAVKIFGADYDTPDGTCVRDYIHVDDLADAHIIAMKKLDKFGNIVLNLGTGRGYSVREVIECCRAVTGVKIRAVGAPRRPGDPPVLVASGKLAEKILDWKPKYSGLETIVESAWRWHRAHPAGFSGRRK
jgi:UDP-glucose 4-epimerase